MERMLVVTTPAADRRVVTPTELAADLGPLAAAMDDAALGALADAASAMIAASCNVEIFSESVVETFWLDEPRDRLFLERTPVATGATVSVDGVALVPEDVLIDVQTGAMRRLSAGALTAWPCGKVAVAYTGGYAAGAAPVALKVACLSVARRLNAGRTRVPFLKSEEVPGVLTQTFWVGQTGAAALNADEAALIGPFIRRRVGA